MISLFTSLLSTAAGTSFSSGQMMLDREKVNAPGSTEFVLLAGLTGMR